MPTVYTQPASVVWGAGKSTGQIEREKEAYNRSVEQAKLDIEKQRTTNEQNERQLASREQERRSIMKANQEQYKQEQEGLRNQLKQDYLQRSNDIISKIQSEGDTPELRATWNRLKMEASMNGVSMPDVYFPPSKTTTQGVKAKESETRQQLQNIYMKYKSAGQEAPAGLQREIAQHNVKGLKVYEHSKTNSTKGGITYGNQDYLEFASQEIQQERGIGLDENGNLKRIAGVGYTGETINPKEFSQEVLKRANELKQRDIIKNKISNVKKTTIKSIKKTTSKWWNKNK